MEESWSNTKRNLYWIMESATQSKHSFKSVKVKTKIKHEWISSEGILSLGKTLFASIK